MIECHASHREFRKRLSSHWPGKEITLAILAAKFVECHYLSRVFDPLGDQGDSQVAHKTANA